MTNLQKQFIVLLIVFCPLLANAQIKYGADAPEIALPAVNGDTLKLSSLKGKVVLLDFWASWCAPCRVANKGLGKLYSKYKSKGFEIFGVSFDKDKSDWKKAIAKDKITWLQVNDDGGWEAPTAINWRIDAIPTSYLIDQNGKLIAMDLAGKELEKKLKEILED
ncbi:MAG TPA: TlpA disulfide reductase family protein [Chitinophagaceae bacterium]|nr:TlpA disulfide reductase family protein [Chitinophagaceae bacterium]